MSRGYKTDCPQCGGNNLYVTPDNGLEYCFNCGYRKGEQQFGGPEGLPTFKSEDRSEIRAFYRKLAHRYHASMHTPVRKYLNERGISDQQIQEMCIGYCPDSPHDDYSTPIARTAGIAVANSRSLLRGRIVFPYIEPVNGEVVDLRGRAFDSTLGEDEPKYRGPYHTAAARGADEWPYNASVLRSDVVVITEGEVKSIVATAAQVPTVGIPGISTFRWRLRLSLNQHQRRVVLFDTESKPKVRDSVYQAIDKLGRLLPNVYVATLPLLSGSSKTGIDDFVLTKGADELKLIVDKALPYEVWAKLQRRGAYVSR